MGNYLQRWWTPQGLTNRRRRPSTVVGVAVGVGLLVA